MRSYPVRLRNAVPEHRRHPKRFCRNCYVERSIADQQNDDVQEGKCQDCHEKKRD